MEETKKEINKQELEEKIISVLQTIYDPEIPVDIFELGLIYEIAFDDDANVNIDPGKLFMAIYQIIKNGCDVTKANGKLFISTDKKEGYLQINVKDSGKGIPDEDKDQIFTNSYSESKGRTRLGLAITKKIIDLHGGQITFSSEINEGTTFTIRIPIITDTE